MHIAFLYRWNGLETFRPTTLEVAHLPIPDAGATETLLQLDPRFIADLPTRTADVERPILPVPVHPAGEDGRGDPKWLAQLFDDMADGDHREHWIVRNPNRHIECSGHGCDDILDRIVLVVGDEIFPAPTHTLWQAQHQRVHQIVDIEGMVESAPAPEHGERPAGNPLEDHEKSFRVTRTIDGGRTLDHDLHVTGL